MAGNSIGIIRAFYLLGVRYVSTESYVDAIGFTDEVNCKSAPWHTFATTHLPTRQHPKLDQFTADCHLSESQQSRKWIALVNESSLKSLSRLGSHWICYRHDNRYLPCIHGLCRASFELDESACYVFAQQRQISFWLPKKCEWQNFGHDSSKQRHHHGYVRPRTCRSTQEGCEAGHGYRSSILYCE